jgi:hypothetical protein
MIDTELQAWLDKQPAWFVCGAAGMDLPTTDLDIAVLVPSLHACHSILKMGYAERHLYPVAGKLADYVETGNKLFEKGDIDLIVMDNDEIYRDWHKAFTVCKDLNLTKRADRLKVHHILLVRNGVYSGPVYNENFKLDLF